MSPVPLTLQCPSTLERDLERERESEREGEIVRERQSWMERESETEMHSFLSFMFVRCFGNSISSFVQILFHLIELI